MANKSLSMNSSVTIQVSLIVILCTALLAGNSWKKNIEFEIKELRVEMTTHLKENCTFQAKAWTIDHMILWVERTKNSKSLANPSEIMK